MASHEAGLPPSRNSVATDAMIPRIAMETILVVDDCEGVCEVFEILLARTGCRVLTAMNADAALEFARSEPVIDLLICDIDVPGVGGDEMVALIKGLHPEARVVFVSRWRHLDRVVGEPEYLTKPFTVAELRDTVCRALHARRASFAGSCAA